MTTFTPHDQLTPGLWYLRTDAAPGWTVVSITPFAIGPHEGELGVWMIDQEGNNWVGDFGPEQFIGPVPSPWP